MTKVTTYDKVTAEVLTQSQTVGCPAHNRKPLSVSHRPPSIGSSPRDQENRRQRGICSFRLLLRTPPGSACACLQPSLGPRALLEGEGGRRGSSRAVAARSRGM